MRVLVKKEILGTRGACRGGDTSRPMPGGSFLHSLWRPLRSPQGHPLLGNKTSPSVWAPRPPPRLRITATLLYAAAAAKSLQSCPTLCDPLDGSPPGSPVPGVEGRGSVSLVGTEASPGQSLCPVFTGPRCSHHPLPPWCHHNSCAASSPPHLFPLCCLQ